MKRKLILFIIKMFSYIFLFSWLQFVFKKKTNKTAKPLLDEIFEKQ